MGLTPEMKQQQLNEGTKYDQDKPAMQYLSGIWLKGVGEVLAFGACKYAPHNWRQGIAMSRLLGACLRHVFAFLDGEDRDPETGLSHLYHASCCLMFASELHITRPEYDDRHKYEKENPGETLPPDPDYYPRGKSRHSNG